MITPVRIPLAVGSDTERRLRAFLRNAIRDRQRQLQPLYENRLVAWRQAYEAQPANAVRSFPFQNASNIVVPIIAIHADSLLARVMASVMKTRPMWNVKVLGDIPDSTFGEARAMLEEFLEYVGVEPTELDLYQVYHEFFGETIRYGTSVLKCPQIDLREEVATGVAGNGSASFEERVVYNGPKPTKLAFQDFLIDESDKSTESSDFLAHIVRLRREELEERAFKGIYDRAAVNKVLLSPDRASPTTIETTKLSDAGVAPPGGETNFAEFDIYECHFKYNWNGHYCRCLVWYHEHSDTIVRAFFNYYPSCIFIASRLFFRDDLFHGYGFAEILGPFQEEISTIHNQRRDNYTVTTMSAFRVAPDSKLWKGYKLYPSAMLPADKDEIEPMPMGQPATFTIDEERLSLDLAERRSGVSPPQQGMGAGAFTKRGVYTAMGTLALMQDGNTRTDLNITDMRYAHTRLGRLLTQMYSEFGIGHRDVYFGQKGRLLEAALDLYQRKLLAIPVYASSASINREVEKQADMMLVNIQRMHFQTITQMMVQIANPGMPPEIKKYLMDAMESSNMLMRVVFRHFEMDAVDRLAPDVPKPAEQGAPTSQVQGAPRPGEPGAGALAQQPNAGRATPGAGARPGLAIPSGAPGMGPGGPGEAIQ